MPALAHAQLCSTASTSLSQEAKDDTEFAATYLVAVLGNGLFPLSFFGVLDAVACISPSWFWKGLHVEVVRGSILNTPGIHTLPGPSVDWRIGLARIWNLETCGREDFDKSKQSFIRDVRAGPGLELHGVECSGSWQERHDMQACSISSQIHRQRYSLPLPPTLGSAGLQERPCL